MDISLLAAARLDVRFLDTDPHRQHFSFTARIFLDSQEWRGRCFAYSMVICILGWGEEMPLT